MTSENKQAESPAEVALRDLRSKLLAAANYIDVLGGDSKSYRAAVATKHKTQPDDAMDASRSGKWLTVVYWDIQPGDEAREIGSHKKVSALSWSHAIHDRDAAMDAARAALAKHKEV